MLSEKLLRLTRHINDAIKKDDGNIPSIRKEITKRGLGKIVSFFGDQVLLTCAITDDDDYYYVCIRPDRKLIYHSCCARYDTVPEEELDPNLSILLWLRSNEPETLERIVYESIERNEVVPFTDIKII